MNLRIIKIECWKCKKEMLIAFLNDNDGPEEFSEEVIKIAAEHGVVIENRYSSTRGESYNAFICPHCKVMTGDFYLHEYWYDEAIERVKIPG